MRILFAGANQIAAVLLLSIAFSVIAGGCSLFGLLLTHSSRVLGELAYSIYLMHGIMLFLVFRFMVGFEVASAYTPLAHWALIFALCPVLIFICCITFCAIERPGMKRTAAVTLKVKSFWHRRDRAGSL